MFVKIISLLGVIKSASDKKKYSTRFPYSNDLYHFLNFLITKCVLKHYRVVTVVENNQKKLFFELILIYAVKTYKPLICDIKMYSFKHFQFKCNILQLKRVFLHKEFKYRDLNFVYLIYTKKGMMTVNEAIPQNLGGILICRIQLY